MTTSMNYLATASGVFKYMFKRPWIISVARIGPLPVLLNFGILVLFANSWEGVAEYLESNKWVKIATACCDAFRRANERTMIPKIIAM